MRESAQLCAGESDFHAGAVTTEVGDATTTENTEAARKKLSECRCEPAAARRRAAQSLRAGVPAPHSRAKDAGDAGRGLAPLTQCSHHAPA